MDTTNNSIQETMGDLTQDFNIKEEFNPHIEENLDVKTESDFILENTEKTEPYDIGNTEQYEEAELHIKNELTINIQPEDSQSSAEVTDIKNEVETESILPTSPNYNAIKFEIEPEESNTVLDDYVNYNDSMDSSEAAALSQVEVCMSDEVNIKSEDVYEVSTMNKALS